MRIALFHNLPSGGAKRTLNESVRQMADNHHIDVYTLSCANHKFGDLRPFVANYNIFSFQPLPLFSSPFGRLNQAIRLTDLLRLKSIYRSIARQIEASTYDVVLAHPCQFEQSPSILRYLETQPTVYYCHEPRRSLYEKYPARPYDNHTSGWRSRLDRVDPLPALYFATLRRIEQHNTRQAGTVLVNSKFIKEAVARIYQVKARVSYHGVNAQAFRPLLVEKQNFVFSVGSLTPLKGFDFLVQAIAQIPHYQRPTLVIASNFQNPPEKAYLEQLANELNVDLKLLCNVSDERLVELYNQAKITVYSPMAEPFGLVPLEAMACGTPVVGVREGGVAETVVHEQTGLLVERDPAQFAAAVQHLLANPELAEMYGRQARQHVLTHWTWEKAVNRLERYLTVCAKQPAA